MNIEKLAPFAIALAFLASSTEQLPKVVKFRKASANPAHSGIQGIEMAEGSDVNPLQKIVLALVIALESMLLIDERSGPQRQQVRVP